MYLFDTDVLSNIIKRKPSKVLIDKLKTVPKKSQFSSAINIGEIYYGACMSNRKDQILKAFEMHVFPNITVLFFDETSGKLFGRLKARLKKKRNRWQFSPESGPFKMNLIFNVHKRDGK